MLVKILFVHCSDLGACVVCLCVCCLAKVPEMVLQSSLFALDPTTTYAITLTAFTSNGMGNGSPSFVSTLYDGKCMC